MLNKIENIVVVMLENRSFDNVVGWLYDKENNPKKFIKPEASGPDHYDGLAFGDYSNSYLVDGKTVTVAVTNGTTGYNVPNREPHEEFQFVTKQLYGDKTPSYGDCATMSGFLSNYATVKGSNAADIMACYSTDQLPVLSAIARSGAISDRWFASVPTQTLANRAFLHCGTSQGYLNNIDNYVFKSQTIFNVLSDYEVSWSIYSDSGVFPSLARIKLYRLWNAAKKHLLSFQQFLQDAKNGDLPSYSFIEPKFILDAQLSLENSNRVNSMHPPSHVLSTEYFLAEIYNSVFSGPQKDNTLLIVTYDEHGGIYDHVSPPWGAAIPDEDSKNGKQGFQFNRFGVRVPTIAISPWIDESVVFRSFGTPYDHTSILATIMDWKNIPRSELPSKRVQAAENISSIITRNTPREIELIKNCHGLRCKGYEVDHDNNRETSGLERSIAGCYTAYTAAQRGEKVTAAEISEKVGKLNTLDKLYDCIQKDMKSAQALDEGFARDVE